MFADLKTNERIWVIAVGAAVAIACGLIGGICAAGAHGVSLVMYLFIEPQKLFECMGDLEPAYFAGAVAGSLSGILWTCLFTGALLRLRRRSGKLPSALLTAGNAVVHSLMAGLLFIFLFLAWSLQRGTAIGFLTVLFLIVSLAVNWLAIGLIAGATLMFALRCPKPNLQEESDGNNSNNKS